MSTRTLRYLLAATAFVAALVVADAAGPIFWQVSTRADFLKGEVDNLSIDPDGRLVLGPLNDLVADTSAPFLWAMAPGPDGSLYVGSGNEGKVFRIDASGKTTTFFKAGEAEVHALVPAPGGGLYVATSPEGKIYKVDASGSSSTFFDPEDKYIWSLVVDAAGTVYAGTGAKGVIYKISPGGKGTPFYSTGSANVVSLAFDPDGNLLAATEAPGKVLRIDRNGKGFVLLSSPFREVHTLRVDPKGVIYAAAIDGAKGEGERPETPPSEPLKSTPIPSVSTEITSISIIDVGVPAPDERGRGGPAGPSRASKGAVYRIMPDGLWDLLWESPDDSPYDLAIESDGALLVASGDQGRLYRLEGDPPRATLLGRAPAKQVTRFLSTPKGDYYATANPGKVFRLGPGRAALGTYVSDVRDTQTVSIWGTISWRGATPPGSRIEVFTRSGNTERPDDTWSPWAGPYDGADGQQILSPKARYLQWKATLSGSGETPVLTSVKAAYLQRNLRPTVTSITVHPPGIVFQKPFSTGDLEIAGYEDSTPDGRPGSAPPSGPPSAPSPAVPVLGRRIYQKGLQTIQWKAEDPNNDKLRFDILYRSEGSTQWKVLKRDLTDPIFVWDTTSVPNGTYLVRIVSSDAPSNPPGSALTADLDSTTFDVDNTPPTIRVTAVRRDKDRTMVTFEVGDDQSPVQRVDYSIDSDQWHRLNPLDGIADSKLERYELTVDGDISSKTIVLRAADTMNNVATARVDTPKVR
jgi:hypothetical protein